MDEPAHDYVALLTRARQGDRAALAELAVRYEPELRVVARVLLGKALRPHLDSLDLVQSVHRSLMVGLRDNRFDLSTPNQLLALAITMVRRKVARHWRRLRRQQPLDPGPDGDNPLASCLVSLSSPLPDPARQALFNDQVEHLCRNLNESERRMLELRSQGHSLAEIAGQLGLHPIALRVRMTRLRQRLKAEGVLDDWV